MASHLIPLYKSPWLRPVAVGEVRKRIIGKVVMANLKDEIISSVGLHQVCAVHGCDSAVHVMHRRNQNPVKPLTWIASQNVPCYIFD